MKKKISVGGQTILEYVIIIGVVVTVFVIMNPMIKRSIQGAVKLAADQIGTQENADQNFSSGYLNRAETLTRARADKNREDQRGNVIYTYNDQTETSSSSLTDLGFTEHGP